ncbi:MAG: FAD-binding protein [Myxococcota bacterium]
MSNQTDVLVIGAGAAGAVAAARAKERGLEVRWIAKSTGASGYSSGAVDILKPAESEQADAAKAFALFQTLTAELFLMETSKAITQMGAVKKCFMVQKSQAFDLNKLSGEQILGVAEFTGLNSFEAAPVAKMLCEQGFRAKPLVVEFKPKDQESWTSFLNFAKNFDDAGEQARCLAAIGGTAQGFSHLLFPAALGLKSPGRFLENLAKQSGCMGSELLGQSHSIPGLRLGNALSRGVQIDSLAGFQREAYRVTEVTLTSGEKLAPKQIILATGRFLSGGFVDKREVLFGLPIQGDPLFSRGLKVDHQQRPLDQFGELYALNLIAAGSSIGGYDPLTDGGLARAILSGYRAGELC